MTDIKHELQVKLQASRAVLVAKLDGLSEFDRRRPLTPSGTNLLGLVKHLIGIEYGYLGACCGRPAPETISWLEDGSVWDGADMWATPQDSTDELVAQYQRACAHSDRTIAELDLDAPADVPWWAEGERDTTLGVLLVRMVDETAHHAGHADIVRELIDGASSDDMTDPAQRTAFHAAIQAAAVIFR